VTINQNNFHPMFGHVRDGQIVRMNNGDTLLLTNKIKGWQFYKDGKPFGPVCADPYDLVPLVDNYPKQPYQPWHPTEEQPEVPF
jgi:hypothetical protein